MLLIMFLRLAARFIITYYKIVKKSVKVLPGRYPLVQIGNF